jgi:hypothetical protein
MGHNYTLPTIKLLFATARTCAYPGCQVPLVFEDAARGIRSVAVQIAHIRSPKPSGPRHDPAYPDDKLNSEDNLLLLCNKHHHPVDGNESKYTTGELLEWKKAQVTDAGGFLVQDGDIAGLASALQASVDELVRATRLQIQVRLIGGRCGPHGFGAIRVNLDGLDEVEERAKGMFLPGRLIGVEAENRGIVGAEVQAAGIDIDHGPTQPGPWQYAFPANTITPWQFPCRVEGNATRAWFEAEDRIRRFVDRLHATRGLAPQRFRAWATLGNGDQLASEWIARADLPVWEPGVGEAQLRMRFGETG